MLAGDGAILGLVSQSEQFCATSDYTSIKLGHSKTTDARLAYDIPQ